MSIPVTAPTVPAWFPTAEYQTRSRLRRLMAANGIESVDGWHAWAREDIGRYWDTAVKDLGLQFSAPYSSVVEMADGPAFPEWFVGGRFNYVANALDRYSAGPEAQKTAIIWEGDDGAERNITFRQLHRETNRLANVLREQGIARGDVVGIFLPMLPETVATVLACGKIGAI
ncbi:MAG: AMP-binding protein, partial [Chloroflexota bacterium]|nr:AMP-binding protein [Chloroflexota bacterium]